MFCLTYILLGHTCPVAVRLFPCPSPAEGTRARRVQPHWGFPWVPPSIPGTGQWRQLLLCPTDGGALSAGGWAGLHPGLLGCRHVRAARALRLCL